MLLWSCMTRTADNLLFSHARARMRQDVRQLQASCPATCYGGTCDDWLAYNNECWYMEQAGGCDCAGCDCGGAVAPVQRRAYSRTALSIAASNSYPCAAPVDERCVALLRSGAVWSIQHHALVPAHEKVAASARALMMMGVRRWDAEGKPYKVDIGPARGEDGVERLLPREVWELIFSFLIFEEGYRDARPAKRRRIRKA